MTKNNIPQSSNAGLMRYCSRAASLWLVWHKSLISKRTPSTTEIRRLKAKIAELEEDKLILKKAAAFFARESR
nr:hypothetical protein [Pectobacterium carotovorum]